MCEGQRKIFSHLRKYTTTLLPLENMIQRYTGNDWVINQNKYFKDRETGLGQRVFECGS